MGMTASVFTDKLYRNSRKNKPGGQVVHLCGDRVTIVNVDGPFDPNDDRIAVMLKVRNIGGRKIVHAEPVDHALGLVGPMSGGAYVSTSDGRFSEAVEALLGHSFYGAIPLHDRYETTAAYTALSK